MSRAFRLFVTLLAAVFLTGGQWAVLQSVAWTSMFADYIRDLDFTNALEKTFDGEEPCPMCCAVKEGREQEERNGDAAITEGVKFACAMPALMPRPRPVAGRVAGLSPRVLLEPGPVRAPPPLRPPTRAAA